MVATNYVWDELGDNVLLETDGTGVDAVYTNEPEEFGSIVFQERGGDTSYYHLDVQDSMRQLTDADETVTDTATYSAFGEKVTSSGTTVNPWGYKGAVGYFANANSDELYTRARALALIGRWLSVDPIGPLHSLYVYADNNPILLSDPSGLLCQVGNAPKCCCCPQRMKYARIRGIVPNTPVQHCFQGQQNKSGATSYGDEFKATLFFENRSRPGLMDDDPCELDWWERTTKDVVGPGGTVLWKACTGWQLLSTREKKLGRKTIITTGFETDLGMFKCPTAPPVHGFVNLIDCPFTAITKNTDYRLLCISIRILNNCPKAEAGCRDVGIDLKQVCRLNPNKQPRCKMTMGRGICSDAEYKSLCPVLQPP